MERQKSMEKGLLRKSLSIRERKFPNEDAFLEAGLSRKSPREVKKPQNDDGECRVTASVFLSTFVAVSGSFCTGCGVSLLFSIRFRFRSVYINRFLLWIWCWIYWTGLFIGFVGWFFIGCSSRDYQRFISFRCRSNQIIITL